MRPIRWRGSPASRAIPQGRKRGRKGGPSSFLMRRDRSRPPPVGGGLLIPSARRMRRPSHGGANNEATRDLGPVLVLKPIPHRAVAQPPPKGVVDRLEGASHPSPAPAGSRTPRFGPVGHVAPFLAYGRRLMTTFVDEECRHQAVIPRCEAEVIR